MLSALDAGYTHIDTAQIYENEEDVGNWLQAYLTSNQKKRQEIWITTKIWIDNYDHLTASLESSLQKLKLDYVDLLLLHRPTSLPQHEKCLNEMQNLVQNGKIKHFWVSNFNLSQLKHAQDYTNWQIFTNQIEYHAELSQKTLKDFMDSQNIVLTAYSPLWHWHLIKDSTIQNIASKHSVSPAQVCIQRLLQQNCRVIPKASTPERILDNFKSANLVLDLEDLAQINLLPKNHRYVNPPFAPQRDS